MTSVSKDLRAALDAALHAGAAGSRRRTDLGRRHAQMAAAAAGRARKASAPHEVECVYIPDTGRGTLCVSSQVGCTLTCTFCHTGTQRLVRNLTAGEIVGQVMVARDRLGDWPGGMRPTDGVVPSGGRCITNIVMMGMGEPLYNFEAVRDALLIVPDGEGSAISKRRITLSTSGVVPNDRARRRRDRLHAGGVAACGARRIAQRTGAAQPQISDRGTAGRLPQLSRRCRMPSASPSNM